MKSQGRVVLVTGASGGIGQATVEALLADGAEVVAQRGRQPEPQHDERVAWIASDLREPAAVGALWQAALAWKGHIDVLVNNAAIMPPAPLDLDAGAYRTVWLETLQVNLLAAAELCRLAIRHFGERGRGIVINVSSRAAFRGDAPEYMHYAASKGALVALTRSIARQFAAQGVLAYDVAPGFVDTPMAAPALDAIGREAVVREIPLGEVAPPSEVARMIAFLASGSVRHATGSSFHINGASYVH